MSVVVSSGSPDTKAMYMAYMGNGHHFKDKRPNIEKRAGGLWAVEGPAPGTEHYQEELRRRFGAKAEDILDLAGVHAEPVDDDDVGRGRLGRLLDDAQEDVGGDVEHLLEPAVPLEDHLRRRYLA